MKLYNNNLESHDFELVFTTSKDEQYIEKGQTMLTMGKTIEHYLDTYKIDAVELVADKTVVELAYYLPF